MKKHLTRRTKWILGISIPLVLIIVTACVFLFGGKKGEVPVKPEDSISICLTPPTSGAPEDYDGLENIGYIAGKLRSQPYYHSDMKGSVDTMVSQEVYGYKDYKDGVLITSSISIAHSSLAPSKALQKFFGDGKAVIRTAASDKPDDWKGTKTVWATGKPSEILSRDQYEEKYGMWGNELTDYIINSGSLLSCTKPEKGADGVYTMTASLDPKTSTYYYKKQMITMGELSTYPEFESIQLTFRFQEDWTLLSYDIHEKYETYVSVITADCDAKMTTTFTYDEAKVDVSAYNNYFKKYADAAPIETPEPETELGAREYLTAAFAPLLLGESGLDFTAEIGGNTVAGKLALDISLNPDIQFNGVQANIGGLRAGLVGQDVVLAYQDFNGKIPLNDLLSLLGVNPVGGAALDADELLGGLMEAPLVKEDGKAYLNATLELGGFPVHISFAFNDGGVIALEKIKASLEISGLPVVLTATLGDKTDFVELDGASATDVTPFIEEIVSLIQGKNYALDIRYGEAGDEFTLSGRVLVNAASGVAVGAELTATYDGIALPLSVVFMDDCAYVQYEDIKLKGTTAEIEALVTKILALTDAQPSALAETEETEIEIAQIVNAVLSVNYDELIKGLSLTENELQLCIDGDKLLEALTPFVGEIDFTLGEVGLSYERADKSFGATLLGAQVTLTASNESVVLPENAEEYVSITKLAQFIDPIYGLVQAENIAFAGAFETELEGVALGVALNGYVTLGEEMTLYIHADVSVNGQLETLEILYKEGGVTLVYGGMALAVPKDEISLLSQELSSLLNGNGGAVALVESEGLDIAAILEQVGLYNASEDKLGIWLGLSGLVGSDVSDFDGTAFVQDGKICLTTSAFTASGITLENVAVSLGAEAQVTEPDYSDLPVCTNVLEFVLGGYREFADSEYLGLDVAYTSEELDLALNGTVQFASAENGTASVINLDVSAAIQTREYDEASGAYLDGDTHYLRVVILEKQAWVSYSLKAVDAPTAVFATLPVSELFVAGGKILPVLSPMLGITEDVYYYDFVVKILSGAYETINTDIVNVMTLEEWLGLIRGIIEEQSAAPTVLEETETAPAFVYGQDENGDTRVEINSGELSLKLTMLKNAEASVVAPTPPEGASYIDISSIATLLTDVLNAYAYKDSGYALSGDISLAVGSLSLKDIEVNLQIKTDEDIALTATIVPKDDTVTRLTIRGGYVYITRAVESREIKFENWQIVTYKITTTEHRAMTMEQFSADMMNQIYFILNLSDFEQGIINSAMKDTEETDTPSEYDTGDMVKDYAYNGTEYDITLNLGAILNDSAFGDVNAVITRQQLAGKEYYDLTKIDATIGISVLDCNISLQHDSAIDPTKLELGRIETHLSDVLAGFGYADFESLHTAADAGMITASSQTRVKA